jgi:hypothetical protein
MTEKKTDLQPEFKKNPLLELIKTGNTIHCKVKSNFTFKLTFVVR